MTITFPILLRVTVIFARGDYCWRWQGDKHCMNLSIIGAGIVDQATARLADEYGHRVVAMSDSRGP